MKRITRLSLVLIMFSLFSISYLVTSVSAQNTDCKQLASAHEREQCEKNNAAPGSAAAKNTNSSSGITDWFKGRLKSLGIGADDTPPKAGTSAAPIVEGGEGGGPAAQDMSGKMINDGGYGANSADEARAAKYNKCVAEAENDATREQCKILH